ncbi:aminotransferase class I/II-fold pyridoxal phosphate-dependent enzyme [Trinickia caryophylli]|uniref:histidinol-phosphate transaminase n=1 Tax=Trinickia caryophylli TaxID=28094 RepID=A0A1X7DH97_TRICW|nr:aminotransferase class I/II-fold pyridoxal phosphate-dependent enzyme [Trinickia caryophylli]PMS12347.1 histidinol phosphate aminotransferase [Trinickia caryophylli]TRX16978.1 aminotransferase class I/II-fold pyridoxal phosphate-dependent enzyme [Trinickia caryophylli]WQE12284.1 aminotransferase class I/II-fold pyridoxal phosphate-dependent enzyme [Trinickia caryophylli]SMF15446.1 histidinol-phosphate aminotransferase [Trinickia caryophylli]GLU31570.1 histidinol-phosphate aminotransferase [
MSSNVGRRVLGSLPGAAERFPAVHATLGDGATPLHLNESPYPPSPRVLAALQDAFTNLNRYPEPHPAALIATLARLNGVADDTVLIGPGSDDLLLTIALAFLEPGDVALMPAPSFGKYHSATLVAGGQPVDVPLDTRGAVDLRALAAQIGSSTRLVFVPTPNNPTGAGVPGNEIAAFAAALPDHVIAVFDLAYHEFALRSGGADVPRILADSGRRWICLRTLSKAYCLAGLRLGYAICGDAELQSMVLKIRSVFNVGSPAIAAALAALGDAEHVRSVVDTVVSQRERLREAFEHMGLAVLPSQTNFLAVRLGARRDAVLEALRARGIFIAKISHPDYAQYARVTIGTADENRTLLAALRECATAPDASPPHR